MEVSCIGYEEMAKLLIASGANINIKNNYEKSALDFARSHNHEKIAQLLLLAGAKNQNFFL